MTDLELTKLCAEAMGFEVVWTDGDGVFIRDGEGTREYYPFHDDAQAMALVKKCGLSISGPTPKDKDREFYVWCAFEAKFHGSFGQSKDLNRAIVECVAKMQLSSNVGSYSETGIANNG